MFHPKNCMNESWNCEHGSKAEGIEVSGGCAAGAINPTVTMLSVCHSEILALSN
jgi:hypothetical protein